MLIHLHSHAKTTPKVRAEIQACTEPARALSKRYGAIEQTVWTWRKRKNVNGRSHTAHPTHYQPVCGALFRVQKAKTPENQSFQGF